MPPPCICLDQQKRRVPVNPPALTVAGYSGRSSSARQLRPERDANAQYSSTGCGQAVNCPQPSVDGDGQLPDDGRVLAEQRPPFAGYRFHVSRQRQLVAQPDAFRVQPDAFGRDLPAAGREPLDRQPAVGDDIDDPYAQDRATLRSGQLQLEPGPLLRCLRLEQRRHVERLAAGEQHQVEKQQKLSPHSASGSSRAAVSATGAVSARRMRAPSRTPCAPATASCSSSSSLNPPSGPVST